MDRPLEEPRSALPSWVLALALAIAVTATFAHVPSFAFVSFDDDVYVTENEHVTGGLTAEGLRWAFTGEHGANWHPLTSLSHMLDVELAGLDPRWHHGVNLALHVANVLLLFGLLASATRGTTRDPRGSLLGSAAVAALFGLHPLHVEAVAWVSERKELLCALFGFLSAWLYVSWTRRGGATRYGLALVAFALGLLSKPMLVTWPFVLLLLDLWPLGRLSRTTLRARVVEKLPFLALAAASSAVTFAVQRTAGAMPAGNLVPFAQRAANAVVSYVRYLDLALRPAELAVLYPHPYGQGGRPWTTGEIAGAVALLAVLTAVAARRRYALVGWLVFLGTLVPVLGLVQVGSQGLADRYTYVPLTGVFVAVTWGALELAQKLPRLRPLLGVASLAVLVALGLRARGQAETWRDSVALFENAVRVAPRSPVARTNLVLELERAGRLDEAFEHVRVLVELAPGFGRGHTTLGVLHHGRGELDAAVAAYRTALELDPRDDVARHNLGTALRQLERWDDAELVYRRWLQLGRSPADAQHGLGSTALGRGDLAAALEHLTEANRLAPRNAVVLVDLGAALAASGRGAEALARYREALRLDPSWEATLAPRMRALEQVPGSGEGGS